MLDELRELYQEVILDHGRRPRNLRRPPDANRHAEGDNPMCGDRITVYLKLGPDERIEDVAFQGRGCAISQASASMMTELLVGKSRQEIESLFHCFHQMCTQDDFDPERCEGADMEALERLQVLSGVREFPMRVKCATLAWHTMQAALNGEERVSTED